MAQWYEKNPKLFNAEVKLMEKRFPQAKLGFMPSNKNMYWVIKMNISETGAFKPWTFALIYQNDHPNNREEGGSIKVIPLDPKPEELMRRVKESKGKYNLPDLTVPHLLLDEHSKVIHLCTRTQDGIADGITTATTGVQTAAWAAEWAMYFELSMCDNRVWNKWVDHPKYKRLIIKNP